MPESFLAVAPTDADGGEQVNTIRAPLRPVAVWELDDSHFAFDSSVLLPSMTADLAELVGLIRRHPECPIAIFGHADPSGEQGYNKLLSGRRATALYAFLTRRVDLWHHLHQHPMGRDDWSAGKLAVRVMRTRLQEPLDEPLGAAQRPDLYRRYMEAVCVDEAGQGFAVPPEAFLGRGADQHGKADYQGCGEFNPLLVFSTTEQQRLSQPAHKAERDEENAPNRRVTVMFFPKWTAIPLSHWPCPRASEGVTGCKKRFWSDAAARRKPAARRRVHPADRDTFACRFYDRLSREDPRARDAGDAEGTWELQPVSPTDPALDEVAECDPPDLDTALPEGSEGGMR